MIKNKALQEVFQRESATIEGIIKSFREEFKSGEINFNSKIEEFSKSIKEYHEQVEKVKEWNKKAESSLSLATMILNKYSYLEPDNLEKLNNNSIKEDHLKYKDHHHFLRIIAFSNINLLCLK